MRAVRFIHEDGSVLVGDWGKFATDTMGAYSSVELVYTADHAPIVQNLIAIEVDLMTTKICTWAHITHYNWSIKNTTFTENEQTLVLDCIGLVVK